MNSEGHESRPRSRQGRGPLRGPRGRHGLLGHGVPPQDKHIT